MFFQFFAQEINIAKDILVKPALSEVEGSNGMAVTQQLIRFLES